MESEKKYLKEAQRYAHFRKPLVYRRLAYLKQEGKLERLPEMDELGQISELEDGLRLKVVEAILDLKERRRKLGFED